MLLNERGTELNDGMTSCGYIGMGATYGAGGAERCDRKHVAVHARFVEPAGMQPEAQLSLSIMYIYPTKRTTELTAGLTLSRGDARKLALAIAPPEVAQAYNAMPLLVKALQDAIEAAAEWKDETRGKPLNDETDTWYPGARAALAAAGVAI